MGAVDTQIKVTGSVFRMTLICEKQKTAAPFDSISLTTAPSGRSLAVVSGPITPTFDRGLVACVTLVLPGGITHGDWKRAFSEAGLGSESTFNRRLKDLVAAGSVVKDEGVDPVVYRLTDDGREAIGVRGAN